MLKVLDSEQVVTGMARTCTIVFELELELKLWLQRQLARADGVQVGQRLGGEDCLKYP